MRVSVCLSACVSGNRLSRDHPDGRNRFAFSSFQCLLRILSQISPGDKLLQQVDALASEVHTRGHKAQGMMKVKDADTCVCVCVSLSLSLSFLSP